MSEQPTPVPVTTAFMVVIDRDGTITLHTDALPLIAPDREATLVDISAYCGQVVREIELLRLSALVSTPEPEKPSSKVAEALTRRRKKG